MDFRGRSSYREQTTPRQAAEDLRLLGELGFNEAPSGSAGVAVPFGVNHRLAVVADTGAETGRGAFRLRRYGRESVELSALLPVLESFGLVVVEAVPHQLLDEATRTLLHIDDIGLRRVVDATDPADHLATDAPRLVAALEAVASNSCDVDSLNRLVLAAALDWRQVALLRAYRRYRRQTGVTLHDRELDDPLVAHPKVTAALLGFFAAKFGDGRIRDETTEGDRFERVHFARSAVLDVLDTVVHLEEDQVLRAYLQLIDATVRTNFFRRDEAGRPRPTVVVKLDSSLVPGLTPPLPAIETWVHGPTVEGIHLRNGRIARGGIRWSDRPDDFRTEVLALAEAQVKKNAIIVPTGAKGGFVVRSPATTPGSAPSGVSAPEVENAYRLFIESLFDVTDNVVGGTVEHPPDVVAPDGDDPYLVVAADRGTATFSDAANAISEAHGFWLGDAFASGGSHGYDHKAMGITARGAWVAVRRHFHQLDIDVGRETIRVVGVGDMSGDVFGNGMLRSQVTALVGAFDHRHIFLDPNPDPKSSFSERQRLASLASSSWDDYDRTTISAGGGVWPRDAKAIEISAPMAASLGMAATSLSPPELISALLRAPVDLLFFGGIGTYIKDASEPDGEVGDSTNDVVRVTAEEIRARVIAEGGNLAITQRGRIRYSRRGGRINTDFIDNAAGVATSDREVNLKILLSSAIEQGRMTAAERDGVLAAAQTDVAREVLRAVDHSVVALNRAVPASAEELDAHEALVEHLEHVGALERVVECLPTKEEFALRRAAGAGLIRPELAVLLAYAKSDLVAAIEVSALVRDSTVLEAVERYFPPKFAAFGADLFSTHRLASQIGATAVAGELVDQMGITWAHETAAELDRSFVEVAAAFWAAREVLGAAQLWSDLEHLAGALSDESETALHRRVTAAIGSLARRYLLLFGGAVSPEAIRRSDEEEEAARTVLRVEDEPGPGDASSGSSLQFLEQRVAALDRATYVADAAAVATATAWPIAQVLDAFASIDRAVAPRLLERFGLLRATSRWGAWQARALVDDLIAWRARAVRDSLSHSSAKDDVEVAIAGWVSDNSPALRRVETLIGDLDPERRDALSVASLLVRALSATA